MGHRERYSSPVLHTPTYTRQDKMLRLLAVLVAVSAVWAQDDDCGACIPDVYQGIIGQSSLVGIGGDIFPQVEGAFVAKDKGVNRAAGYIDTDDGTPLSVVIDYNSETLYVADRNTNVCQKSSFEGSPDSACLQDSVIQGEVTLGGGGNSMEVVIESGVISKPRIGLEVGVTILANPATCLPVTAGGAGSIRLAPGFDADFSFGQSYFNMEDSISDPGVLYPPESCNNAEEVPLEQALQSPEVSFVYNWFTD